MGSCASRPLKNRHAPCAQINVALVCSAERGESMSIVSTLYNGIDFPGFEHSILRFFTTPEAAQLRLVCVELYETIAENPWMDEATTVLADRVTVWRDAHPHAGAITLRGRVTPGGPRTIRDAHLLRLRGLQSINMCSCNLKSVTDAGWASLVGVARLDISGCRFRGGFSATETFQTFGGSTLLRLNGHLNPLAMAVAQSDVATCTALLVEAGKPGIKNKWMQLAVSVESESNVLGQACTIGFLPMVIFLLSIADTDVNAATGGSGATALHFACLEGRASVVEALLAAGADVDAKARLGHTPLIDACCKLGHVAIAKRLLDAGASAAAASFDGHTPLINAACYGSLPMIELLLGSLVNVNAKTARGITALHNACAMGYTAVVHRLLVAGADIEASTKDGYTPLITAAHGGSLPVIELLLSAHANVKAMTTTGITAFRIAIERKYGSVAARLWFEE